MINIIYGINVVKNLLKYKFNYIEKIYFLKSFNYNLKINNIKKLSNKYFIKIKFVNKNYFKFFFNNKNVNHQGVLAIIKKNKKLFNNNIKKLFEKINKKSSFFILFLDRINDPYNLGACIRTSVGLGVDAIIISKNKSASVNNNIVHKTSSGAIYKIFILEQINLINLIFKLRKYNFYVIGTCINSNNYINNCKLKSFKKIILILGSEENGIKKIIKNNCDLLVKIPLIKINSLNVSVANGILLYELLCRK